jgi:hypothetical protein
VESAVPNAEHGILAAIIYAGLKILKNFRQLGMDTQPPWQYLLHRDAQNHMYFAQNRIRFG